MGADGRGGQMAGGDGGNTVKTARTGAGAARDGGQWLGMGSGGHGRGAVVGTTT